MRSFIPRLALAVALLQTVSVLSLPLAGSPLAVLSPARALAADNPIVLENQQPGSTGWQIDTDGSGSPLMATNHQIEGYASLTSVNAGGQINFMVSLSSAAQYTMQIYRMGWYGGTGGRLMQTIGPLIGSTQPACPRVTTTTNFGLTECSWATAYTLTVPTTWTTGNYIVKLIRGDSGLESYMTFVVRNDAGAADIVLSEDVTTWQAYNFWGGSGNNDIGYNLYGQFNDVSYNNTSSQRAHAVSFNRPYLDQAETDGAGNFFLWDYPMIHWLEAQGYNVTYATNVDIESNPNLLAGRKAFINTGHDEYYSDNMRTNLQGYINGGAHMGFFSANNVYNRIRWANSSSGQPDRTVICYKDASLDPQSPPTIQWRSLSPSQPENALLGVMQNGVANDRPFEVNDASSWIYAGTGLLNYVSGTPVTSGSGQNAIAGIVGYEFDERAANASSLSSFTSYEPAGLQQVAHSNVPASDNGVAAFSDATVYTATSGAIVFSAGTIQWSWGLDRGYNDGYCSCNVGYDNSKTQQITTNILNKFLTTTPTPPAVTLSPTSLTFASQPVNTTSPSQTVTLTNSGSAPLTISSIGITGPNASDFAQTNTCPSGTTTLAAGASCAITVTFKPAATGSRSAGISITDNAAGSPQAAALSGTGASAPAVTLSPASLTFNNQQIGTTSSSQTVTLTNSGSAPLSISSIGITGTNAGDFAESTTCPFSPITLAAGGSCTINVTFTPTAGATRTASLSVTDDAAGSPQAATLAGIGTTTPVPAVSLSPTSLTFATQAVNTTSPAQTVTLTNSGNAALTISGISLTGANPGDFAQSNTCPISPSTLAAGSNCTISVTFAPPTSGTRTANLSVTDDAAGSPQAITLTGTGSATAGTYLLDDFESGNLNLWNQINSSGGSATVESTTVNSGTSAAALTNKTNADDTALYAGLAGGGQTSTYSRFCFNLAGISSSTVLAQGRDVSGNSLWEVDYDAGSKGLDAYFWNGARARSDVYTPANLVLSNAWYCAEVEANETSTGHGELWLNGISVGKVDTNLSVTNAYSQLYLWNNGSAGTVYMDDVKVANAYNGPVGAGAAPLPTPAVNLSPSGLNFASQTVNTTSGTQAVTLTNSGNAPLIISNIGITGTNAGDFGQSNTCPLSPNKVAAGGSCTINVSFTPTAAGSRNASLSITDNAGGSPQSAALTGTGVLPPAPAVTLGPTSLTFASQTVNTNSAAQTVTLTNTGNAALTINSIGITGTNASDFIQTNTCPLSPSTLAVNANCTISVTFDPVATGSRTANLSISDNAGGSPHAAALTGTGALPAGTYLTDDFENGLRIWTAVGTGSATVQSATVNSGTHAAALTNASGQFIGLSASLAGGGQTLTYSRFCFNVSGISSSTILAQGRDAGGNNLWEVDYDAGNKSLDLYLWNGARTRSDLYSPANLVVTNAWQCAEVGVNEAGTGHGELWINGISVAKIDTDLSVTSAYSQLYLWNNWNSGSAGTVYIDDVKVDNAYNGPVGVGATPVSVSPTSVSFGNQLTNTTSGARALTVANTGNTPLTISSIGITGANSGDFSQTNTCPFSPSTLAAGTNCTVNVIFTPTAAGGRSASLTVTDDASTSPQTVTLSGTGTDPAPVVGLSPTSLTYSGQQVNTTSGAQTVTLTNAGNAALAISGINITGTNTSDFAQTNTCPLSPSTLAVNASCTISVTFSPTATGSRSASLSITDNAADSPQTVALTGAGTAPAVTLNPTSLGFGNQLINTTSAAQTGTLTNSGTAPLAINSISITGTNSGDFAQTNTCPLSPSTLAAGGSCTISVTFTPSATGSRTASLSISDNAAGSPQTVALTGTGTAAAVSLSPTSLSFASQTLNTTSAAQAVTLTNSGTAALTISSVGIIGSNAGDFAQTNSCPVSPSTLPVNSNCTISVTFKPTASGTRTASVSVSDNAAGTPQTVALSGIGTTVSLSPSSLNFGNRLVNTISPAQAVTLTNVGATALTINSLGDTGTNAGDFSQTTNCPLSPSTLAAGAQCTINVTFKPTAIGTRTASLTVADNAADSPQTVPLSGTGTQPGVTLSATSLSFGNQLINTTGATQTITLTNTGTGPLSINNFKLGGTNPGDFAQTNNCPGTLAVNANCTINVTFSPNATGTRTATLSINDNAPNSPQTVALSGTGIAPVVSLSPTSLTFGNQAVNTTSSSQTVTLTNTGTAALTISSITITGANAGDFGQTNNCPTGPSTLPVGGRCTISVTFKPTAKGNRKANLTVTDNASGSAQRVALTGTGM
jgi:Abnormal spindle-like microcephaly-assoc'd, ASPM-SPD-2-Hydin